MSVANEPAPGQTAPRLPDDGAVGSLTGAYSADVLRRQMTMLRREAEIRAGLEKEIKTEHASTVERIRRESEAARKAVVERHRRETGETKQEYAETTQRIEDLLESEQQKLDEQRSGKIAAITRTATTKEKRLREDEQFESIQVRESHDDKRKDPARSCVRSQREIARSRALIVEAETKIRELLVARRVPLPVAPPADPAPAQDSNQGPGQDQSPAQAQAPTPDQPSPDQAQPQPSPVPVATPPVSDPLEAFEAIRADVVRAAQELLQLPEAVDAFSENRQAVAILIPMVLGLAAGMAGFIFAPGHLPEAMGFRLGVAAASATVVSGIGIPLGLSWLKRLRNAARQLLATRAETLFADAARGQSLIPACEAWLMSRRDEQVARIDRLHQMDVAIRKKAFHERLAAVTAARDRDLAELESKYQAATESLRRRASVTREAAERKYPLRLAALETACREDLATIERRRDEGLAAADRRRDERWTAMTAQWRQAREITAEVYVAANRIDASAFPPWEELAREDGPLPSVPPPGLRFGTLSLSLERVPGGVSTDPALNAFGPVSWTQPATVAYPTQASILVKTTVDQKEISSAMMQALMLRIASGIPPGQSRFMIVDPLGLGKQFAGFMHLADYDELLVTSRIWTEPSLIEAKLADITDQMEVVIQKYLRNEYASIGDYNADAEVPEPYKFVVVANFPANFTETSARRLASIAASGPRCGVYVIVSVDTRQPLPSGFSLSDLEQHATTLVLDGGRFSWEDPEFRQWPLTVERAPSDEVFTRIIQRVGKAAKAAKRVEVPFDRVAPKEEEWWQGSTATEVLAPLGPAGARKLQYLRLGRGTSQHALIAGKTGSGKSTLMHAMITSLALQYSPKEIQFYLIDFKKGVEFKLYDHYRLPHARVIAIESEREFGLSVLQQLDAELKRRGDLFRELSVQDVAGFRRTGHADPMPRILLLIDEFQEMFVEDDKLAQDASLILDRLVRQGRAFGMHVLLGSQTLGGSYSLPRATMGQMAVRIALQCNEADSSLILSEDNTAARLLTRPGEAIYNDANGMVDGNSPFQVVFLNDERRERYLGALRALADRRDDIPKLPRIVFDGNEAANPAENRLLAEMLEAGTVHGRTPPAPVAWLGDAIAIKDPTAAIFRRQGGANLLMVGQREDLGACLLAMSLVSLAACHDPHPGGQLGRPGRFVLLEPAIAEEKPDIMVAKVAARLPHEVQVVGRLGVAAAVAALAAEVERRLDEQVLDAESVYLVIRDLARYRELRRNDGDFGFSFGEQKAGPAQHLLTIIRDGPTVGVHAIIWCDSLTNLQRTFERNTLKDFEIRVLFQMSSVDSSQLIDSPLANKLGPQRALFIHEETGVLEKFRPYAFPSSQWLGDIETRLRGRPQGTPADRPAAAAEPAVRPTESFGVPGGFGDFNFAKFLDDPPAEGDPPPGPAAEA